MKNKVIWLVVSCLMVLSLVLASCAPAVAPEKEVTPGEKAAGKEEVVTPGVEMVKDSLGRLVEKPKPGGWITLVAISSPTNWDATTGTSSTYSHFFFDVILTGDWTKGPTGTGEFSMRYNMYTNPKSITGQLAESWEVKASPQGDQFIFNIRKGIRFPNKPPLNGRGLTADDVVFSLRRYWTPPSYAGVSYPAETHFKGGTVDSIYAPDKYTVILDCQPGYSGPVIDQILFQANAIVPHELYEKYGNVNSWDRQLGSGPFMCTDYVPDSSITLVKNPDYWREQPLYPGEKVPFVDGVTYVIIPDASTRLAGLRAGRITVLNQAAIETGTTIEEANSLWKANPELKWSEYPLAATKRVYMNVQKEPFDDIRVRRALCIAVDRKTIGETIYGGTYWLMDCPIAAIPDLEGFYTPLEQLPEETRQLFEYHPDRAKQLLAEAGYPNGFQTSVLCTAPEVDMLAIVREDLLKIGVDMTLNVKEPAVKTTTLRKQLYDMLYQSEVNGLTAGREFTLMPKNIYNFPNVNDPVNVDFIAQVYTNWWDIPARQEICKKFQQYVLDQAYCIHMPVGSVYSFWQPWLKDYNGEYVTHYCYTNGWIQYSWIDQDLKEKMTGKR